MDTIVFVLIVGVVFVLMALASARIALR